MNWKWYIPLLIVVFAFAGTANQDLEVNPNQEISIEFLNSDIDEIVAEDVISDISFRLESLGAKNVRITKMPQGKLKIVYFSTLDISEIKDLLRDKELFASEENQTPDFPLEKTNTYNIAISSIQKFSDSDNSLNGVLIEINRFQDNFVKPKLISGGDFIRPDFFVEYESESLSISTEPTIIISDFSDELPEIRAGPAC